MFIQPIDIFVYAWLIAAVLSAAYVAWDQFAGNPEPAVMKWGFVLVTLYMGPIGLLPYVMADKEPRHTLKFLLALTAFLQKQGGCMKVSSFTVDDPLRSSRRVL